MNRNELSITGLVAICSLVLALMASGCGNDPRILRGGNSKHVLCPAGKNYSISGQAVAFSTRGPIYSSQGIISFDDVANNAVTLSQPFLIIETK